MLNGPEQQYHAILLHKTCNKQTLQGTFLLLKAQLRLLTLFSDVVLMLSRLFQIDALLIEHCAMSSI